MKFYKICFSVGLLCVSFHLHAKGYEYIGNCTFNGYMDEFEHCLDKELAIYDKELNNLYRSFFKRGPQKKLRKIEQLWIKFKEADCDYMAREVNEGLEFQVIYRACLINKTKARIADLKRSYFYSGWFVKNT